MRAEAASAPTTTGISNLRPSAPTTLVNRKARRLSSGRPPANCQRTSGCSSVSLLIGRSTRTTRPCASSVAKCCWKSVGGPAVTPVAPAFLGASSIRIPCVISAANYALWRCQCNALYGAALAQGKPMSEQIKSSRDGMVVTITIDRPAEGNVLTLEMLRALTARLKEAGTTDAKVIALRSTGADFCKGRDGKGGPPNPTTLVMRDQILQPILDVYDALTTCRSPSSARCRAPP